MSLPSPPTPKEEPARNGGVTVWDPWLQSAVCEQEIPDQVRDEEFFLVCFGVRNVIVKQGLKQRQSRSFMSLPSPPAPKGEPARAFVIVET